MSANNLGTPGPAHYNPDALKTIKTSARVVMGKADREDHTLKVIAPDPGQYNPNFSAVLLEESKWSFPHSQRPKPAKQDTPSAQSYSIKPLIGNEGPRFVIGRKLATRPSESSPGPIYKPNYDVIKRSMPAFTVRLKNVKMLSAL